jgi:hypothetical protein
MTNDAGTFIAGTVVDRALIKSVYDQIDDQCHSTSNVAVLPLTITDEVILARGSEASLNARIATAINSDGTLIFGGALNSQLADVATSGTGATDIHSYTMPANTCDTNGDRLVIRGAGTMTGNANTKTFTIQINGVEVASFATAGAGTDFMYEVLVYRRTSTTAFVHGYCNTYASGSSEVVTTFAAAAATLDFSASQVVKSRHTHAVAGTITEGLFSVDRIEAP